MEPGQGLLGDTLEAPLAALAGASTAVVPRRYDKGEVLYRQDEPARYIYYVRQGRVRTYILSPEGKEQTFLIVGAGNVVGDVAFHLQSPCLESAEAFGGDVEAYQINRAGLDHLLQEDPRLTQALLVNLAARTWLLVQEFTSRSFQDVRGQLQVTLLQLAGQHGIVTSDGIVIDLRITHEDLAKMVGASRARVTLCLSQLRRDGFCRVVGQRIVLAPWAAGQLLPP